MDSGLLLYVWSFIVSRYMAGQKEYEVELQFTSGLLSSPDRTRTNEENVDGEKAIFGSRQDMQSQMSFEKSRVSLRSMSSEPSTARLAEESSSSSSDKKPMLTVSDSSAGSSSGSSEMRKVRSFYLFIYLLLIKWISKRIYLHKSTLIRLTNYWLERTVSTV